MALIHVAADGCWRWTGTLGSGRPMPGRHQARRVVGETTRGPLPPGVKVRVDCPRLDCVNPDHARLVELGAHGRGRYRRGCRCPTCRRAEMAGPTPLPAGGRPRRRPSVRPMGLAQARARPPAGASGGRAAPHRGRGRGRSRGHLAVTAAARPPPTGHPAAGGPHPGRRPHRLSPARTGRRTQPPPIPDPAPIRARLDELDELYTAGLFWVEIQRRTGLSEHVIRQLRRQRTHRVTGTVAERILALSIPARRP